MLYETPRERPLHSGQRGHSQPLGYQYPPTRSLASSGPFPDVQGAELHYQARITKHTLWCQDGLGHIRAPYPQMGTDADTEAAETGPRAEKDKGERFRTPLLIAYKGQRSGATRTTRVEYRREARMAKDKNGLTSPESYLILRL